MPRLPVISGKQAISAFVRLGWVIHRQKGSHVTLKRDGSTYLITIPLHDPLGRGLLRDQIRKADITVEDFIAAL